MAKKKSYPRASLQPVRPAAPPRRSAPGAGDGDGDSGGKPPTFWRTAGGSLLSFALVIGAALAFKGWVADIYFIPSGSMEPTLYGRTDGGDRIACLKLPYRWRTPERWEIGVFEFPLEHAATLRAGPRPPRDPDAEGHDRNAGDDEGWRKRRRHEWSVLAENRGQNYIKRFVGLPGETIQFSRGDLWRVEGDGAVERLVKPPEVQRHAWIPVYAASWDEPGDAANDLLAAFWSPGTLPRAGTGDGDAAAPAGNVDADAYADADASPSRYPGSFGADPNWEFWQRTATGSLLASPPPPAGPGGTSAAYLEYQSRVPDGRGGMVLVPGVVDRYMVRQPLRFYCDPERRHPAGSPDGRPGCGRRRAVTIADQKAATFCRCGALLLEDAVEYYHRRSSLPVNGPFSAAGVDARQRETVHRRADYNLVGDLRLAARFRFPRHPAAPGDAPPGTALLALLDDARAFTLRLSPAAPPRLEVTGNDGRPLPLPVDNAARPAAGGGDDDGVGGWRTAEIHQADGRLRFYLDGVLLADEPAPPRPDDDGERVAAAVRASGVRFGAISGAVEWGGVRIDRDIYYYSGAEPSLAASRSEYAMTGERGRITLAGDEYLALGDNAPSSFDSRGWGPVPAPSLRGTAVATWWPPHRPHRLNRGLGGE